MTIAKKTDKKPDESIYNRFNDNPGVAIIFDKDGRVKYPTEPVAKALALLEHFAIRWKRVSGDDRAFWLCNELKGDLDKFQKYYARQQAKKQK